MDKRALETFAREQKKWLEEQIKISLRLIGILSSTDINSASIVGDRTVIRGIEKTYPKHFKEERDRVVERIKEDGYDSIVEECAYTWFNRIVALRFMEVHNYLGHGYKLFPTRDSKVPEIMENIPYVTSDLNLKQDVLERLSGDNLLEERYRYILIRQCHVLNKTLSCLFSNEFSYLDTLLPQSLLLNEDSIIRKIVQIDESNFKEDVEVIGWMYQFYISDKKDEVFASKQTITKKTLPAVTQLFTPDWIVKYMVENSLGRLWLESYPDSSIKETLKYYVEDAEQTDEVKAQLEQIRYKNVNPEDIKVVEPCCGSGHILVYMFDVLMKMYTEKGYTTRDIPKLILKKNIVGFDVDKRATQLSIFALIMKARSIDPRFFNEDRFVTPKVYEIKDSKILIKLNAKNKIREFNNSHWKQNPLTAQELSLVDYLVNTFEDGKTIGSLLIVKKYDYVTLRKKLKEYLDSTVFDLLEGIDDELILKRLIDLCKIANNLSNKYDVMVTNPPYIGISSMEEPVKKYAQTYYPNSKTDMFAMFMETGFIKQNGFTAMINMQSWMFLKSFEKLRYSLLDFFFTSMLHLGTRAFEEISGDVVSTTSFVFRKNKVTNYNGAYYRLTNTKTKENAFLSNTNSAYYSTMHKFASIPSCIFAYWISKDLVNVFTRSRLLSDVAKASQGMATGDNNKFVRFWWEVNIDDEKLNSSSREESISANKKWVPYNKGGSFRKWYGNNDYIVYFKDFGASIASSSGSVIRNSTQYLLQSITWGKIGTGPISFRYKPFGHVFDVAGTSIFANYNLLIYLLGLCNSCVVQHILEATAPTINYEVGQISNLPIIVSDDISKVNILVEENIKISKVDWNSSEMSWNFDNNHFFCHTKIEYCFDYYAKDCMSRHNLLKKNEILLNEYFINLYGLNNELDANIDDSLISLKNAKKVDYIKELISFIIGLIFGRFSLSQPGLVYAGGEWNSSKYDKYNPDNDGIIMIYEDYKIKGGLADELIKLIKLIYGEDNYQDNINFIADALGKKSNEVSEQTLARYLFNDYYYDHLRMYQNRPIYWLLSSGTSGAFKCLFYLHRYSKNTLATINSDYLLKETNRIKNEIQAIPQNVLLSQIEKESQLSILITKQQELLNYGKVLDFLANKYISLDLDDGVKANYAKFQGIELTTDTGKIKLDLLAPIK
jgi:hypothetical protein